MEQTKKLEKLKIIAVITVLIMVIASCLFLVGFSGAFAYKAEASEEEAVNLLNNEVILKTKIFNDDESIMLSEINYALDITEGTTYRIYVNIDGLEVDKEIDCVCTSSDNVGFEDGPAITLGSIGEYACFLMSDDNEESGAIIGFANNATYELINEDGLITLEKENNGYFWCMYYGMAINNVTVHAITLASDPLMSFEGASVGSDTTIMEGIIDGAGEAVVGLAGMVLPVFQRCFMNATTVDGVTTYDGLNAYGIALCSFTGLAIAIYIFKKVVHLVRNRGLW